MSIAKICRLLACCSSSPSARVQPTPPPEQTVTPPIVAPQPVKLAFVHQHNPTMAEAIEFLREDPIAERKPTLRRY